jgi:predicted transcriptional regulator
VEVDVEVKCYVISAEIHLEYKLNKVRSSRLSPEKNLTVTIDPESKYINKGGSYYFTVTIEFPKKFDKKVDYNCQLRLQAEAAGYDAISRPVTLTFIIVHEPESNFFKTLISSPIAVAGIFTIVTVGILGAAIGSTEVGKYRFLLLLFIPLYTKLHKDKILDHFTRGRVYEYVRNNPGVHYSEIKRELELNNGSLAYHLHTLEREALIKSISSGRFKLFYPTGVKIPKDMEPQMSIVRKQILDIIRDEPGISQSELGSRFDNKTQRTISYHVKTMSREGVLRLEKVGRENKCYLNDDVAEISSGETTGAQTTQDMEDDKYLEKDTILRQI